MVAARRNLYGDSRRAGLLIHIADGDSRAAHTDRSNACIAGGGGNRTVASTGNCHSGGQCACIQLHRSLIQAKRASRLADRPLNRLGGSRAVAPAVVALRCKGGVVCTGVGARCRAADSQLRRAVIAP